MVVDLNIDLGELPDEPEELYRLATVVNLACGGHAGDDASMKRSLTMALRHGARIAAHPSFPDREQFGRARIAIPPDVLYESIVEQLGALKKVAIEVGARVWGAKPHGALYHAAGDDRQIAAALLDAVVASHPDRLVIVGPPWGHLEEASRARELRYEREGFADRSYDERGRLLPRGQAGDILVDPKACAKQAMRLAESGTVETICVHGDTPHAVAIAREVRGALEQSALLRLSAASHPEPPRS